MRSESEIFELPAPENYSTRYEPLPLVPDTAVQAHAYRDSEEETAFFAIVPADAYDPDECRTLATLPLDPTGFHFSTVFSSLFRGQTFMRILTYRTDRGAPRIRLARCTMFARKGGNHVVHAVSYDFDLADLLHAVQTTEICKWSQTLLDLVHRRTDRACLHVRFKLTPQG